MSVAESLTGGLLGERITLVPGSSDYFVGGFIAYSDRLKTELLGVDASLIERRSAVSEEVALAMAEGARSRTRSTYAVSVTGEAGPVSASGAPPGRVYIGLAGPGPSETRHFQFPGVADGLLQLGVKLRRLDTAFDQEAQADLRGVAGRRLLGQDLGQGLRAVFA